MCGERHSVFLTFRRPVIARSSEFAPDVVVRWRVFRHMKDEPPLGSRCQIADPRLHDECSDVNRADVDTGCSDHERSTESALAGCVNVTQAGGPYLVCALVRSSGGGRGLKAGSKSLFRGSSDEGATARFSSVRC